MVVDIAHLFGSSFGKFIMLESAMTSARRSIYLDDSQETYSIFICPQNTSPRKPKVDALLHLPKKKLTIPPSLKQIVKKPYHYCKL